MRTSINKKTTLIIFFINHHLNHHHRHHKVAAMSLNNLILLIGAPTALITIFVAAYYLPKAYYDRKVSNILNYILLLSNIKILASLCNRDRHRQSNSSRVTRVTNTSRRKDKSDSRTGGGKNGKRRNKGRKPSNIFSFFI